MATDLIVRNIDEPLARARKRRRADPALHDLTVVTRNTADFAAIGVATHNPFS